jgi:hypothetical protein
MHATSFSKQRAPVCPAFLEAAVGYYRTDTGAVDGDTDSGPRIGDTGAGKGHEGHAPTTTVQRQEVK